MLTTIFIIIFSLLLLMIFHELGHFLFAKLFKVKVEEFGVGYPPRLCGKKIGKTLYSLNCLPFGAFVKIKGEESRDKGKNSFSQKPIWQRALIIFGGVLSFWIIAFIILTFSSALAGIPTMVSDNFQTDKAKVQIVEVAKDSPAETVGIEPGDVLADFQTVEQAQNFIEEHIGKEAVFTILRNEEIKNINVKLREDAPAGQGILGVGLARVINLKTSWHKAPLSGLRITARQTKMIFMSLVNVVALAVKGEKVSGVKLAGPIGIGQMMGQALSAGFTNFLMFIVMLSLWLAIANLLPIPALDGGKLLFLGIEAVRQKPISEKVEVKITTVFFIGLIALMLFVTFRDIIGLF